VSCRTLLRTRDAPRAALPPPASRRPLLQRTEMFASTLCLPLFVPRPADACPGRPVSQGTPDTDYTRESAAPTSLAEKFVAPPRRGTLLRLGRQRRGYVVSGGQPDRGTSAYFSPLPGARAVKQLFSVGKRDASGRGGRQRENAVFGGKPGDGDLLPHWQVGLPPPFSDQAGRAGGQATRP
jgi:hypothetical protein